MSFLSISLSLNHRKVVIIGGGQIALRRARYFSSTGADIRIYGKELCTEMSSVAQNVYCELYKKDQLENAFIVIAATNDKEINRQICSDGRLIGALVNNVSDRFDCDFHIPAVVQYEDCTIAISSGGENLAGAIAIRDRVREMLDD